MARSRPNWYFALSLALILAGAHLPRCGGQEGPVLPPPIVSHEHGPAATPTADVCCDPALLPYLAVKPKPDPFRPAARTTAVTSFYQRATSPVAPQATGLSSYPSPLASPPASVPSPPQASGFGAGMNPPVMTCSNPMTWNIYPLSDLGQEGKWLADTIQQVVQPQSWTTQNGQTATVAYHPQGKLLVVYNTPAVQEEVGAFLSKLKKALPAGQQQPASEGETFRQVGFRTALQPTFAPSTGWIGKFQPGSRLEVKPTEGYTYDYGWGTPAKQLGGTQRSYVVPRVPQPKHLFHFIIRYEGEGIIDSSVVDMVKVMYAPDAKANLAKNLEEIAKDKEKEKEKDREAKPANPEATPTSTRTAPAVDAKPAINWRTDYRSARKEAAEKKLPMMIQFYTAPCHFCVMMEENTFQNTKVISLLNEKFVPLKVNCKDISELAIMLKVYAYPTFVFASSDGKVMQRETIIGFKEPARFLEHVQHVLDQPQLPDLEPTPVSMQQPLIPPPSSDIQPDDEPLPVPSR